MDLPTALALISVGKPAADVAKDLVVRFLGPSVDIGGDALKEWIEDRVSRWNQTATDAVQMIEESGQTVRPVPGRLLLPIIEHSTVENDDDLRRKWTALLANAATERHGPYVLPAYAEILRQLTPVHAKMLDWIFDNAQVPSDVDPHLTAWRDVRSDEVSHRFGLNKADYQIVATDLHRLQVIDGRRLAATRSGTSVSDASTYNVIALTPLGVAFMQACRPPQVL